MLNFFKSNQLLIFLILLLCSLGLLVPDLMKKVHNTASIQIKQFQPFEEVVSCPDSFYINNNDEIYSNDPNIELEYSVDGGDKFIAFSNLKLAKVKINNLSNYNLSIRSKPVNGSQPEIISIIIKGKHKEKEIYIKETTLSYSLNKIHEIPIISLNTSEKGMFSEDIGIMVLGIGNWFDQGFNVPFWDRKANYKLRSEAGKRKVKFDYIKDDQISFSEFGTLQISGNATRSFPQKSMKIKTNRAFGKILFDYDFFGKKGIKKYTSLVIRNSGNDNTKTLFADLLMQNLATKANVFTQKGKQVVVYLNGNYWGLYNMRERIDIGLIAKYKSKNIEEITILEGGNGALKDGLVMHQQEFLALIDKFSNDKIIDSSDYDEIKSIISMKSFIDYMILETFYANGDWLNNNAIWFKAGSKKWQWILNDLDYGLAYLGSDNVNKNMFDYLESNKSVNAKLFQILSRSDIFKKKFRDRANIKIEEWFSEDRINKKYNKLKLKIEKEILFHIKRWRGNYSYEEWELNCKKNLTFLQKRKSIYLDQIKW